MKLRAEICKVERLCETVKTELFALFSSHYDGVSRPRFDADLESKTHAIVLKNKQNVVCGFSTIVVRELNDHGRKWIGVFSGDTIIKANYWGGGALQLAFTFFVMRQKIKNPLRPVYWYLMSKGFKTYLLLANNFLEYYPRYDRQTPPLLQRKLDLFYAHHFKEAYDKEHGTISFGPGAPRLKQGIADITKAELLNPKIKFFVSQNPDWEKGVELACIGKFTIGNAFLFASKKLGLKSKSAAGGRVTYSNSAPQKANALEECEG